MPETNGAKSEAKKEILLALETSGDVCGLALFRDGQILSERNFRHNMRLSERLMEITDGVLRDAEVELADVDAFAVGIGPGSFTGTRIGVMTAKTWAVTMKRPIIGVNALEAMAAEYSGLRETLVCSLLPCRPGTVFAAAYTTAGETPHSILEPAMRTLAEVAEFAQNFALTNVVFCGLIAKYCAELAASLADSGRNVSFAGAEFPRAAQVARLAWRRWQTENNAENALDLVPLYITPPQITPPRVAFAVAPTPEGE